MNETRKSRSAYAPTKGVNGVTDMVKVGEIQTPSGSIIEYFCPAKAPSLNELMDNVTRIASNAVIAKISKDTSVFSSSVLSSLSKGVCANESSDLHTCFD